MRPSSGAIAPSGSSARSACATSSVAPSPSSGDSAAAAVDAPSPSSATCRTRSRSARSSSSSPGRKSPASSTSARSSASRSSDAAGVALGLGQPLAGGREPAPGGARLRPVGAGEGVEHGELERRAREPPLLELPGHGDQPLGRCGHVLAGHAASPGVGTRAPVREDAAGEHERLLALGLELGELAQRPRRPSGQVELRLDVGLRPGRPDHRRIGARAEQHAERLRQDRLAGARLPRDRVQPRAELELGLADEHEVLDAQATKQSSRGSGGRRPTPAASRAAALLAEPYVHLGAAADLRGRVAVDQHRREHVRRVVADDDLGVRGR